MSDAYDDLNPPPFIRGKKGRAWATGILAQVNRDRMKIEELRGIIARVPTATLRRGIDHNSPEGKTP